MTTTHHAQWLHDHLDQVRQHPSGPEAIEELRAAIRQARATIDRPADRWYAGRCGDGPVNGDGFCGTDLYAKPDAAVVTCPDCGAQYDVAERRAWLREAVEDVLATAVEIAGWLRTFGHHITDSAIRSYAHRGRLATHQVNGRPLYRVGDVMDILAERSNP